MLIAVRNDVMRDTQRKQVPWEHSALTGRFYFGAAAATMEPPKAAPARLSEAAEAWTAAERSTSVTALEAFIARYKDTFYAELARARIAELKAQQAALSKSAPEQTGRAAGAGRAEEPGRCHRRKPGRQASPHRGRAGRCRPPRSATSGPRTSSRNATSARRWWWSRLASS